MKAILFVLFFPVISFAANIHCNADLSTPSIPLLVTELNQSISSFSKIAQSWTSDIKGTDFKFTVQAGLTRDVIDEDEDFPTYVGKPGLRSLVIYNSDRSQVARFDVPNLEVLNTFNLTVGSQAKGKEFRVHVFCHLKSAQ